MKVDLGRAFGVMVLLFFLTACSVQRQNVAPVDVGSIEPEATVIVPPVTPKDDIAPVTPKDDIALLLEQQGPLAALTTLHLMVENGHPEMSLSNEYLQALQGVLRQAGRLMAKGDYSEAGSSFKAALDLYPREAELAKAAPLSIEQIKAKIETCADALMEDGLLAYRAGNLETAIGIWEEILSFQPRHEASQKAIYTADQQLTNLKTLEQNNN